MTKSATDVTHYGSYFPKLGCAIPWKCGKRDTEFKDQISLDLSGLVLHDINSDKKAQELFEQLKDLFQSNTLNFPEKESRIIQLIYLASMTETQSPYSKEEMAVFSRCWKSDQTTKKWLQFGLASVVGLTAASWVIGVKAVNQWLVNNEIDYAGAGISIAMQLSASCISWISTGSNPDFKSDSANHRQDHLIAIDKKISLLAKTLIKLKHSNIHLAQVIANNFDLAMINKLMLRDDLKSIRSPDTISIDAACCYVLNKEIPEDTSMETENYIINQELIHRND